MKLYSKTLHLIEEEDFYHKKILLSFSYFGDPNATISGWLSSKLLFFPKIDLAESAGSPIGGKTSTFLHNIERIICELPT
jgi:hypothetical protein